MTMLITSTVGNPVFVWEVAGVEFIFLFVFVDGGVMDRDLGDILSVRLSSGVGMPGGVPMMPVSWKDIYGLGNEGTLVVTVIILLKLRVPMASCAVKVSV